MQFPNCKFGEISQKIKGIKTIDELVKYSNEESKKVLAEVLEKCLQEEILQAIGTEERYKHKKERSGYLNSGYKRRLDTSIGTIEFKKPRVVFKEKGRKFQSKIISRYQRRDSRLVEVTLIGYFLGLSCRKTMAMLQKEYGTILSPSGVSRVLKVLDERKREFHSREILKYYRFIWMDGMYVKVRSLGKYWLLLALGETMEGEIELIDYRLSERENEASYEDFLENLRLRGLKRPVLFITDGHKGLQLAIRTVFSFAKIQVCVVHKKRDVLSKTSLSNRDKVSKDLSIIYASESKEEAIGKLKEFKSKWKKKEPLAVRSLQYGFHLTLTYFDFDKSIWNRIKTNNPIERYIEEIRRRTIPMRIFQNIDSLDRLIYGIIEILKVNMGNGIYERANLYFQQN